MSTLHIPQDVLDRLGGTEHEARIEIACRLFESGKLTLFFAGQFAGLTRSQMEDALLARKIPLYRPSVEELEQELKTLEEHRGKNE